jgi:hypothetical protein
LKHCAGLQHCKAVTANLGENAANKQRLPWEVNISLAFYMKALQNEIKISQTCPH